MPPASSSPTPSPVDALLEHAGWLNRLARHLCRDGDLAADLTQEVWLAAHRAPPDRGRPARPWLGEVLRNALRMHARAGQSRRRREAEVVVSEPEAATPESVSERLELHRLVVEAVLALDEPLRAPVLLRYFEERSSAEIAALLDVPAGTVRWRLKTALEELRRSLDRRCGGDRRRWAIGLAPLAAHAPTWLGKGVIVMTKSKSVVAAAAVLLLALGGALLWSGAAARLSATAPGAAVHAAAPGSAPPSGWSLPPRAAGHGNLRGRITHADGRAAADAAVTLTEAAAPAGGALPRFRSRRADGDGRYTFAEVPPGPHVLVAVAAGALPTRRGDVHVPVGADSIVDLRLAAGGVVVVLGGRVFDAGGGPIAGARLTAVLTRSNDLRAPSTYLLATSTDAEGRFRLDTRAGNHQIRVEASGYAATTSWVAVTEDRTRDFELQPASRLRGRVVTRAGQPVAGAEVLLAPGEDARVPVPPDPVRSDENGRFVFAAVEPGTHTVLARKGALTSAGDEVTVDLSETSEVVVLVDRAPAVSGWVHDAAGQPVPDALVQLGRRPFFFAGVPSLKARSDAAGRFRIDGVLPGRYQARASRDTFPSMGGTTLSVGAEGVSNLELPVDQPVVVEGLVTANGQPAVDVDVEADTEARAPGREMNTRMTAATDERGWFRVTCPAGTTKLRAQSPTARAFADLGPLAAGAVRQVTLALAPGAGGTIEGRVVRADGGAVEAAHVQAHGARFAPFTRADRQGRFRLTDVDSGTVRLFARTDEESFDVLPWNRTSSTLVLGAGERRSDVTLTLPARQRIAGHVQAPDGTPLEGVTVVASWENAGRAQKGAARRTSSGLDGAFTIADLGAGTYTVTALNDAYPVAAVTGIASGASDVVVRFQAGCTIAGSVVDPAGAPVPSYVVSARADSAAAARSISRQVHAPGARFQLERLAPGAYRVEAESTTGARAETRVTCAAGAPVRDVELVARAPAALVGRLVDGNTAAPIAGADVQIATKLTERTTRTGPGGDFVVANLPAGARVDVQISAPGYELTTQQVSVPAGEGPAAPPIEVRLEKTP